MKLKIEIDMDNAAFEADKHGEAKRIIEDFLHRNTISLSMDNIHLYDLNGSYVGFVQTKA